MSLIWPEDEVPAKRKRRYYNPRPKVPATGWKLPDLARLPSLKGAKMISYDVETKDPDLKTVGPGWGRGVGHIIGVALGTDDGFSVYLPCRHEETSLNLDPVNVMRYVNDQLSLPCPKLGHNSLYDLGWLTHEGVTVNGELHDTWIAAKLIKHQDEASLEKVSQKLLGTGKVSNLLYEWGWNYFGKGPMPGPDAVRDLVMSNLYRCPPELVGHYAESDVELPHGVLREQWNKMDRKGLHDVYRLECDLLRLLVAMRIKGVAVDLNAAEQARDALNAAIVDLQADVDKIAGRHVNTGSPVEMGKVFDRLKISYPLTPKTQKPQLKAEFLKTLEHPLGQMVVDLQELKKYVGSFIDGSIFGSSINGRVHGSFNPMRAVTGRMSASDPNLQQIPSRNDLAKKIRSIFIPHKGHSHWRKYDYSSIESRLLAHFAVGQGAKALRKEYKNNPDTDYHDFTKAMIHRVVGLDLPRKHVKNVNFAGIYGASQKKLQSMMGLSDVEAEEFFTAYHDGLPYVSETMEWASKLVEEQGFTQTILGRISHFDMWEPKWTPRGAPRPVPLRLNAALAKYGPNLKRSSTHKALNHIIQGSAADLMKSAMVKCWNDGVFDRIGVPTLVVHDELDFSVEEDWDEEGFEEMRHIMETVLKFRVPIRVEGEWGKNWSELYPLDPE
jgi:DNA polymerase I-like protein with 3'-5' exonuclease and polymerase domains